MVNRQYVKNYHPVGKIENNPEIYDTVGESIRTLELHQPSFFKGNGLHVIPGDSGDFFEIYETPASERRYIYRGKIFFRDFLAPGERHIKPPFIINDKRGFDGSSEDNFKCRSSGA
jgi:hypothetical protein